MAKTLRWAVDRVLAIRKAAIKVEKSLETIAKPQFKAAAALKEIAPIASATGEAPTRLELAALMRSGSPWTTLAQTAKILQDSDSASLFDFARRHLLPVDELRWRLFHLGVLGVLLASCREHGWRLTSRKPLSASTRPGPHYELTEPDGTVWQLWFEADNMWGFYGLETAYQGISSAVFADDSPMGADIAIVRPGEAAFLFECKYGKAAYVKRDGFHQISTYIAEASGTLAPHVRGFVVGPDDVIPTTATVQLGGGDITFVGPRHLSNFLPTIPIEI
ncbi:hypothetical protein ACIBSV_23550 [Embleya sp. NPDC050154]|uniref:hypothetical protein n=1 Tax=Embleya sp. NPDC050154 TaxID=3363988 RepID=UPI0037AE364E